MAKSRSLEEDKTILVKKVKEHLANNNSEAGSSVRSLRKRLKRVQRKSRALKVREQRSSPKTPDAAA